MELFFDHINGNILLCSVINELYGLSAIEEAPIRRRGLAGIRRCYEESIIAPYRFTARMW
ncbi:hypothetical protein DI43_16140 [Geobacillus sp. CAMR12739]|nr:hypothetical protein DI43_16140 [Geobacillus sp. CAMR12739]